MNIETEHLQTKTVPRFGRTAILLIYAVKVFTNSIENRYMITAEVKGIENRELYLQLEKFETFTSNPETLNPNNICDELNIIT